MRLFCIVILSLFLASLAIALPQEPTQQIYSIEQRLEDQLSKLQQEKEELDFKIKEGTVTEDEISEYVKKANDYNKAIDYAIEEYKRALYPQTEGLGKDYQTLMAEVDRLLEGKGTIEDVANAYNKLRENVLTSYSGEIAKFPFGVYADQSIWVVVYPPPAKVMVLKGLPKALTKFLNFVTRAYQLRQGVANAVRSWVQKGAKEQQKVGWPPKPTTGQPVPAAATSAPSLQLPWLPKAQLPSVPQPPSGPPVPLPVPPPVPPPGPVPVPPPVHPPVPPGLQPQPQPLPPDLLKPGLEPD